jgi:uncharacterized membrane protein YeaQ/YmgE (transglycosylase-associated protein family)
MDQGATIVALIIGAIISWMAARVLKRTGFGIIGDFIVGVIGGFLGAWIWTSPFLHPPTDSFLDYLHVIAASAVGSLVLLVVWRLARH